MINSGNDKFLVFLWAGTKTAKRKTAPAERGGADNTTLKSGEKRGVGGIIVVVRGGGRLKKKEKEGKQKK